MIKQFVFSLVFVVSTAFAGETDYAGYETLTPEVMFKVKRVDNPAPTVILIHGGGGVRGMHHLDVWSYFITEWGYNAVIIDLFSKRGFRDLTMAGQRLSFKTRAKDVVSLANHIKNQPWHTGSIGAIGFSQGGSTIFALSKDDDQKVISAGIAYYPACAYETPAFTPNIPTQMHLALSDTLSNPALCGIDFFLKKHDVHRYENVGHVFDVHNLEVFAIAKEHTRQFLIKHLSK